MHKHVWVGCVQKQESLARLSYRVKSSLCLFQYLTRTSSVKAIEPFICLAARPALQLQVHSAVKAP